MCMVLDSSVTMFSVVLFKSDGGGARVVLRPDKGHEQGAGKGRDKHTSGGCGLAAQTPRADQKPFRYISHPDTCQCEIKMDLNRLVFLCVFLGRWHAKETIRGHRIHRRVKGGGLG